MSNTFTQLGNYLSHLNATDFIVLALGLSLLVFGRRLYWMALGGLGFFFGLGLAKELLGPSNSGLELGLAFLVAILAAWLTILAQKVAIALGGALLGGLAGYWFAQVVLANVIANPIDGLLWIVVAIGALVGVVLGALLFDAALIFLSSIIGALLMASRSSLESPRDFWLFLILACVGILLQSRRPDKGKDEES